MPGHNSTTEQHKPLLCLLNLHHHWQAESTPDGDRYVRCSKCGKDRDEDLKIPVDFF